MAKNKDEKSVVPAQRLKVAVICGGPSVERGISLNSARSVLDHLGGDGIEVVPFYLDAKKSAHRISSAQLYSNTPSDFDFKLAETAKPLSSEGFARALRECDIAFPVMHGPYGEDGGIQQFLERHHIPFVGSGSEACKKAFDKYAGNQHIRENGFFTLPSALLKIYGTDHKKIIQDFFKEHAVKRAIVKPASGGSSIGVFSVSKPEEALDRAKHLFGKRADTRVVIEPFAEGKEFTVIILQNRFGIPVALPPTEIETDYTEHQIFDFRKKYLPTRHVTYHSPPRFADSDIERIQAEAEQLFALFGMRDFARFDGWILPDGPGRAGNIWFCDFNTISGMEQNSFLFQQAARVGMTHRGVLRYVLESAVRRHGIALPPAGKKHDDTRKPVAVLFGGPTSERQVSLMSGTNVWLKLRRSEVYKPEPYLLDTDGSVWRLPYHLTLNHTVEEISENCKKYASDKKRLESYEARARLHLGFAEKKNPSLFFDPEHISFEQLLDKTPFLFLALHGGEGEDGTLKAVLEKRGIPSNGPDAKTLRLCMDKWATAERIRELSIPQIGTIEGIIQKSSDLLAMSGEGLKDFWSRARKRLRSKTLIVKPTGDGCSTGVVHLYSAEDLAAYMQLVRKRLPHAPVGTFRHQSGIIEMPPEMPSHLLFERFIESDILRVVNKKLKYTHKSGFVEITVGVVEENGRVYALNPSITVAEGEVLSVEEKFQGGTGVNLTPPPPAIIKPAVVQNIRASIETLAHQIGITGYSRIDAFVNTKTGELLIIEINTLPGLTPSTVLYHQGLAESRPVYPRELLEKLIKNKGY